VRCSANCSTRSPRWTRALGGEVGVLTILSVLGVTEDDPRADEPQGPLIESVGV
jgi:hypothetical protein